MSSRVFIRKPTKEDCPELLSLCRRSKDFHFPWVIHSFNLHRLEANIQPENQASINLVTRLKFTQEGFSPRYLKINGEWQDHQRWALTVENWM